RCKMMGVAVSDLFAAIQGYYGGSVIGNFTRFTKFYRVMMQAEPYAREDMQSLSQMTVRNLNGEMVPLNAIITLKRVFGSELIKRYNMF
ncbi:MAG: efflux RND transporter permease subunit, partial [Bacteroidales bacterium]